MRVIDLTGHVFGMLTVLHRDGTKNTFAAWRVRCACGIEKTVSGHDLRKGQKSCGCQTEKLRTASVTTHGLSHTPTWNSWQAMIHRCTKRYDPSWDRYGGRGIKVCSRWLTSFEDFLADMGERPSLEHSIDRKDVNGDYEPGNCRWATKKQQGRNRRTNRLLTYAGESMPVSAWAERIGLKHTALKERLRRGWSVHKALTTPPARLSA